ncbi:MAG: Crp/Fnr family transcriptional regulator [Bacteroidota bacterium]
MNPDEIAGLLKYAMIFSRMDEKEILKLLEVVPYRVKSYEKDEIVMEAGSPCDYLRVLLRGTVRGEMFDYSGKILKIEDISPPGMLAPAFLFGNKRRCPVTVTANEAVKIWQIHRDDFSHLLQSDLKVLNNYLDGISSRAQYLSEKLKFISFRSIRSKLAGFLLENARDRDNFHLPATHQQLSELFGVTRPALSREFSWFNSQGLIRSTRDEITILDRKGLERIVGGRFLPES